MAKSVLSSAKRLSDNFVKDENVFYYKLETMYEKRGTVEATVPYYGEQIDGPSNGPAPGLWDIPVFPAVPFKDAEFRAEAPHTSQIAQCFKCNAQGTVNCLWCGGSSTRGMGSSRRTCAACTGSGKSKCPTCKGQCQLKRFVQLVVIFTCRTMECMDNPTSLSDDKAKAAEGHMVVDERAERVNKLADFPSKVISAASAQLIDMSLSQFPVERVVEQRQTVKLVPVATTNYGFGKKNGAVRLYGLDRRTDASDNDSSCSIS
ncbi:Protein SSUH2 -like protein [Halotydeus destructor]|nr:Protein SSUH2 -like protein [Halotydeus destructor]